ncbi:PREDICTED: uncharacterized protein LOC106101399 [Papilio polytes]|uniref:uncharacterized protein LOC106101399 n=1 Tax=Papilio polytes TaxID=76194 RepID=UPI0006768565|nr:PREDICTED: uncharacterized protein LOC106101399 [Papilio polytes]
MEDVYTIKVKTKPDTRNLYPSERRYSASTVSGLAWVHIALAATSFLLACLALVNPNADIETNSNHTAKNTSLFDGDPVLDYNVTDTETTKNENSYMLVLAPSLLTVFALAAGVAAIMASVRWYVDHNITWLFVMSVLSTLFALIAFVMIAVWFITTSEEDISEFYKDKVPFKDFIVVKHTDVIDRNESHIIIANNVSTAKEEDSHLFTKRVLSINILIAAFLELLWSILSVKISYKGMRNNYKEDDNERRGNCISVVTTIKGNNTNKIPRNGKLLPPKPDLIEHYPSKKIKRIFLAQSDNGFYLKNQNNKTKQNTETSSEFYKERMLNFLNRCASLEGISNSDMRTPSVQSEAVLNPIPEVASIDINVQETIQPEAKDRMTPVSWGDTPDHTVYNQNTINFEKIFNFAGKKKDSTADEGDKQLTEEISENTQNN